MHSIDFLFSLKPIAEAVKDKYRNAVLSHFLPDGGPCFWGHTFLLEINRRKSSA